MRKAVIAFAVVTAFAASAVACSIPVFRYALEQWRPDPYEIVVYYRGSLSEADEALLERLNPVYTPGQPFPNAAVVRVDLDGEVRPEYAEIWEQEPGESLPWVIARTPWHGGNATVWSGPLTERNVNRLLESPKRTELVERLLEGDSVVWVFLTGSEEAENDASYKMLRQELKRLESEIALPDIRPEDLQELSVAPEELGLRFSTLQLDRTEEEEQLLVEMLLRVEPDLKEEQFSDKPMVFPVFGRGRVYFPLVGAGITPANLEDMARFLCGACQCTVKQQNPGLDLLMTVDWDTYVQPTELDSRPLPALAGLGGFAGEAEEGADESVPVAGVQDSESQAEELESATDADEEQSATVDGSLSGETDASPDRSASRENVPGHPARESRENDGGVGRNVLILAGFLTCVVMIASLILVKRN